MSEVTSDTPVIITMGDATDVKNALQALLILSARACDPLDPEVPALRAAVQGQVDRITIAITDAERAAKFGS